MPSTSRISAELSVPDVVHLPTGRGSTVELEVLARLHNDGDEGYVVGSSDPNDIHNWHVLNDRHREVARPPAAVAGKSRKGVLPHSSQLIPSGQSHNHSATLRLDAKKLKAGKRYTVRYAFHGFAAEAVFTVVEGKPAPKPTRTRATARKAPAKKKATTAKKRSAPTKKRAAPARGKK